MISYCTNLTQTVFQNGIIYQNKECFQCSYQRVFKFYCWAKLWWYIKHYIQCEVCLGQKSHNSAKLGLLWRLKEESLSFLSVSLDIIGPMPFLQKIVHLHIFGICQVLLSDQISNSLELYFVISSRNTTIDTIRIVGDNHTPNPVPSRSRSLDWSPKWTTFL